MKIITKTNIETEIETKTKIETKIKAKIETKTKIKTKIKTRQPEACSTYNPSSKWPIFVRLVSR